MIDNILVYCSLLFQSANGLGLRAEFETDNCHVTMKFPDDTVSKWVCLLLYLVGLQSCNLVFYPRASSPCYDCLLKKAPKMLINMCRVTLNQERLKACLTSLTFVKLWQPGNR